MKKKVFFLFLIILFQIVVKDTIFAEVRFKILNSGDLSINILQNNIDFGSIKVLETEISTTPMIIKNDGVVTIDIELSLINPDGWKAIDLSKSIPGINEFRLFGIFNENSLAPKLTDFLSNDIISTTGTVASDTVFSIDSISQESFNGWGIPPERERNIFFRFDAPQELLTSSASINIAVVITAIPSSFTTIEKKIDNTGGEVSLHDGTSIIIPKDSLTSAVDIIIEQLNPDEVPEGEDNVTKLEKPVSVYNFKPDKINFKKPAEIKLLYSKSKVISAGINENDLKIFWLDGSKWILIGGKADTINSFVYVKIKHLSTYAIFPAVSLTANNYRPLEKIITPATVGNNDYAVFYNLDEKNFEINIYDITGRKVKKITQNNVEGAIWDGKDESGNIVESGVYIYQLKTEINGKNQLISGVIAVAK